MNIEDAFKCFDSLWQYICFWCNSHIIDFLANNMFTGSFRKFDGDLICMNLRIHLLGIVAK